MDVVINHHLYTCEIVALISTRLQKMIENVDVLLKLREEEESVHASL